MATIQGVYVALFGRPADPTGLAYFNGVTKNGADLSGIGDLASTQEYKDRFAGQNNTQIVNSIYQSLFGRDAEAAGLNFFVDALNKGTLNIKNIAIAILDGAQGTDKTISSNKVAAADLYTKALDTATEIGSYQGNTAAAQGRSFITGVTTTVPTAAAVDTAVASMVTAGGAGNTVSLTNNSDTFTLTGGIGTPAVLATDKNDTINSTGANWSTANDTIDTGLGQDTFNLTAAVDATVAADKLKNVEIFNITANAAGAATIDVAEGKQLTQIWNVAKTDGTQQNLTVSNVALTQTVGVKGDLGAGTTSFGFAAATGTSDTATLALSDAKSTGAISIAAIETLNISNTGTSSVTVTAAAAKAINVSGSGDLTFASGSTAVETVTVTGANLTANLSAQTELKTFTGGAGSEKITIDVNHTNDITVNLGAGADQVTVVADGGQVDKLITLTGGTGADIFVFGAAGAGPANVKDVTSAATVAKSLITVTDFNKAEDAIKVAGAKDALLTAEQSQVTAATDLKAAVDLVASFTNGKSTVFTYGSDAYIFSDTAAGGTFNTGDTLIKITGASAADFTDTNLQYLG